MISSTAALVFGHGHFAPSTLLTVHIELSFPRLSEQLCASKSLSAVARGIIHCDDDTSEALMDVRFVAMWCDLFRPKPACCCAAYLSFLTYKFSRLYCTHLQLLTTTDDVGGKMGEAEADQPLFFLDEGPSNEAL